MFGLPHIHFLPACSKGVYPSVLFGGNAPFFGFEFSEDCPTGRMGQDEVGETSMALDWRGPFTAAVHGWPGVHDEPVQRLCQLDDLALKLGFGHYRILDLPIVEFFGDERATA